MAIRPYSSPGVIVTETINPVLAPLIALPSVIAILGSAQGFEDTTDRFIFQNLVQQNFRHTGIDLDTVVAHNISGHTINPGAYVIVTQEDPNTELTGDEPFAVRRAEMPIAAPTVAGSGTGTLTGTYVYAVSFLNAQGETGVGPVSTTVVVTGAGVNLSNIPTGAATGDDEVTGRNIYRAKVVNGVQGQLYRVATIADNTTSTLTNETVSDVTAAQNPVPVYGIASNQTILINYNYTDQFYWHPTLLSDYDDVMDKYGAPFDDDGNVFSTLSFAARFAFANGAEEIVCQAVHSNDVDYVEALENLQLETDVNIIVPASGEEVVHESVIAHLNTMRNLGTYAVAIFGADGSVEAVDANDLRETAEAINNESVVYISPSRFRIVNPVTLREQVVGAQYVAAAVAGMVASRDVEQSLTRKTIAGFTRVDERRTQTEEALDSAAGLFVIRERGHRILQVRHAITTSPTNVNTRELSVVRAKYDLITRARITLESLIGMVVPHASAPLIVQGAMLGVLEQILAEGSISGYANVKARALSTDPTTIEVRFEYTPAYPINNIIINFTINTQTGEIQATSQ
jgi:hypothetical protein